MSRADGTTELELNGKRYKLVYDWQALADVYENIGFEALQKLLSGLSPAKIALLAEYGLRRHHPEMTAEKIMELSPPVFKVAVAIDVALGAAYTGTDTPDAGSANKKK